eukprot:TRINITY_DN10090_c0_g1_i6.p3 TRINITY_DN10090_c0_g1~~TRINITY_DN10090_c0_g1_i6.p3  ORF type:complete len:119 (+),score=2.57 TRINITY_DN10090_c0_g1_i6:1358-1714(+)
MPSVLCAALAPRGCNTAGLHAPKDMEARVGLHAPRGMEARAQKRVDDTVEVLRVADAFRCLPYFVERCTLVADEDLHYSKAPSACATPTDAYRHIHVGLKFASPWPRLPPRQSSVPSA